MKTHTQTSYANDLTGIISISAVVIALCMFSAGTANASGTQTTQAIHTNASKVAALTLTSTRQRSSNKRHKDHNDQSVSQSTTYVAKLLCE